MPGIRMPMLFALNPAMSLQKVGQDEDCDLVLPDTGDAEDRIRIRDGYAPLAALGLLSSL